MVKARSEGARALHNLIYWRSGDWVGVGPGAHGRVTHDGARLATEAQRRPADYIDAVREHGVGWISDTTLTGEEAADEVLVMGLRTHEGVDAGRFEALRGRALNADAVAWLTQQGFVTYADGRIRLTQSGRIVANTIAAELAI